MFKKIFPQKFIQFKAIHQSINLRKWGKKKTKQKPLYNHMYKTRNEM